MVDRLGSNDRLNTSLETLALVLCVVWQREGENGQEREQQGGKERGEKKGRKGRGGREKRR